MVSPWIHPPKWTVTEAVLTVRFTEDLVGGLVQTNRCQRSFQPFMKVPILIIRSRTEGNVPPVAWRSMISEPDLDEVHAYDPNGGVKCRGHAGSWP